MRIIIAGGGTGGHIFPALAIAEELKRRDAATEILFVGAKGGMEMNVIPKHGHTIKGVWISGIHRQLTLKNIVRNLSFPLKLITSLIQSRRIIHGFKPDKVVGVGGYASGPMGRMAAMKGIPLFICEQNAYAGLVNKWLSKYASRILLGNPDAERYFPKGKCVLTGNPIRTFEKLDRAKAAKAFELDPARPTILNVGGSLGALRLNNAWEAGVDQLAEAGIQLIWQCGKRYYERLNKELTLPEGIKLMAFISDMASAYSAADLVVSRAGGSTISELIALEKASILIPSPNVAEDHQTKNARSLADKSAAIIVKDNEAEDKLVATAMDTVIDQEALARLNESIRKMEKFDAASRIVDFIIQE